MLPRKSAGRNRRAFAAHFHLIGCVDFEDCLHVQRRLAYDALTRADGRISVLLCEHPPLVTIGRNGSRSQIHFTGVELSEWPLAVRYVSRGGGCLLHSPGQLAIYPIVPLEWHEWSVGHYVRQLHAAVTATLDELGYPTQTTPSHFGCWGRTGMLAAVGVAVKQGVTSHGAFINVAPELRGFGRVEVVKTAPADSPWPARPILSSLLSEQPKPIKMTAVRSTVVARLAAALGCDDYHMHTGHPLLAELPQGPTRDTAA
jgi:lipoyl(octanoyl) transferase